MSILKTKVISAPFLVGYSGHMDEMEYRELGRRLAAARAYRGLHIRDVAERAKNLGHARGYGQNRISEVENARGVRPALRDLEVFANIYGVDVQDFTETARAPFAPGRRSADESDERLHRLEGRVEEIANLVERTLLDVAKLRLAPQNDETPAREPGLSG